jgi:phosphoadenosine phosphosulfate reductase
VLIENTLFGIVDKVKVAIDRIQQFEPPDGYYVAFSGGKDAIVVKDLVKRAGVKADYHYNLTTVDPPELVYYIREHHRDVEVHKPPKSMWQLIREYGDLPTRQRRWCCDVLKEGGGKGRIVITGVRWDESNRRAKRGMVETCMKDPSKSFVNPIIDWNTDDVWQYIRENNLPYCSLYDEGFTRIGCVICPMNRKRAREAVRWPKIAEAFKRAAIEAWPNLIKRKTEKGKSVPWDSPEAWFNWWLTDNGDKKRTQDHPDQTIIYE